MDYEDIRTDYLDVIRHGGRCCGVIHLSDFCNHSKVIPDLRRFMHKVKENEASFATDNDETCTEGKLIEVILTDSQIKKLPEVVKDLKGHGFKCVSRFKNNTGTFCNVLHYVPQGLLEGSPF